MVTVTSLMPSSAGCPQVALTFRIQVPNLAQEPCLVACSPQQFPQSGPPDPEPSQEQSVARRRLAPKCCTVPSAMPSLAAAPRGRPALSEFQLAIVHYLPGATPLLRPGLPPTSGSPTLGQPASGLRPPVFH